jgi:hypothetical protein
VLSLLGAATLATASNAMALDTRQVYAVTLTTGGFLGQTLAGEAVFDFDSQFFNLDGVNQLNPPVLSNPANPVVPPTIFPGSCVYAMEWLDEITPPLVTPTSPAQPISPTGILPLSAQGWVAEQLIHGSASCMTNALQNVPSIVTLAPVAYYGPSTGFDPFGQIDQVAVLQLGEEFFPTESLVGILQFDSAIANHTVYGVNFISS